jgi:hypothetical protein
MESIEEIAERIAHPIIGAGAGVTADIIDALIADPAFRRLMAEELVKVDMEPVVINDSPTKSGYYFTQDQLTAAVLKEREECAFAVDRLTAAGNDSFYGRAIRSRTERTE